MATKLKKAAENAAFSWQTSLMGLAALAATGYNIFMKKSASPEDVTAIMAGVGLIVAKDAGVTGAK